MVRIVPRRGSMKTLSTLSTGLGLFLGAWMAACSVAGDDASTSEPSRDDELNESKALGMTDVTILYPSPDKWELVDDLMGPSSEDARGELLPASLFQKISELEAPKMIGADGNLVDPPQKKVFAKWADNFAYLRFIGVRLDPCFGESTNLGANTCMPTIRLVGQFFFSRDRQNSGNPVLDSGAAVHAFYKLSQSDFTQLAKDMLALRLSTGLPLQKGLISNQQDGVHPTLREQGLRGAYATALKAIILKYAGEQTLERIAFDVQDRAGNGGGYYNQQQGNPDTRWIFGGFQYRGGSLQPMTIGSLGDYTGLQTIDSFPSQRGDKNLVTVDPPITVRDDILGVFNPVKQPNGSFAFSDQEKGRESARRLQNPTSWTATTADCVSCHMAKHAFLGQQQQQPTDLDYKSYTFRLDATNAFFGPFRMFGWDQGRPVISQRVVNETANTLEYLNKNVLR
jgi:hypothetical protein